jgi:CRP-like cAMP-binding protein
VKVFLESSDGQELVVAVREAGDTVGEMSVLDGMERSASAVAQGETRALRITTQRFDAWLRERPDAARALMQELARRLRESTDQVGEMALLGVEARVARRLWRLFVGASGESGPATGVRLQVNQAELAASLGVTRESVNKHLAKLKARGIVSVQGGRISLLQPQALRELAEDL